MVQTKQRASEATRGALFALAAYGLWGGNPLFFHLLDGVSAPEVVAHRALWSLPVAGFLVVITGRLKSAFVPFRRLASLRILVASALLISINWGFFVWAVNAGRTIEASLGYFINPLMNVFVGFLFLGERFTRAQMAAIALATCAVLWRTIAVGGFPWLALLLAVSFTLYGFLRKTMPTGALEGFFVETIVLSVLAIPLLVVIHTGWPEAHLQFGNNIYFSWLLAACGPVTTAPLLCFAAAARRIRLSTLGLMQYIAPTLMFLTAVYIFGDPLETMNLITFIFIWLALAIYSSDAIRQERTARRVVLRQGQ